MTRTTSYSGYTPNRITIAVAQSRIRDIQDLVEMEDHAEAEIERNQLVMDVLFSIANAPTMADKRELKKLAHVTLEAFSSRET